jgi:hypothetical protein
MREDHCEIDGERLTGTKGQAMKIDFSSQEFRDLLDILHIADVIMSGHRKHEDERTTRHRALVRNLYALAGSEGLERLMTLDESTKLHQPTPEFEQESIAHPVLNEFTDHAFWDLLVARLAERDTVMMMGGPERFAATKQDDRERAEGLIRQRYLAEFSTNGLANLEIIERFSTETFGTPKTSD